MRNVQPSSLVFGNAKGQVLKMTSSLLPMALRRGVETGPKDPGREMTGREMTGKRTHSRFRKPMRRYVFQQQRNG